MEKGGGVSIYQWGTGSQSIEDERGDAHDDSDHPNGIIISYPYWGLTLQGDLPKSPLARVIQILIDWSVGDHRGNGSHRGGRGERQSARGLGEGVELVGDHHFDDDQKWKLLKTEWNENRTKRKLTEGRGCF